MVEVAAIAAATSACWLTIRAAAGGCFVGMAVLASAVALTAPACAEESETSEGLPRGPLEWVDAEPAWSPDGKHIVFTRGSPSALADDFNLRVVDVSSGSERPLTEGTGHRDRDPTWSRDGRTIAFTRSLDTGFCEKDDSLHLAEANGTRLRDLGISGCEPAWSPDGSRLALLTAGFGGIAILNKRGRIEARIRGPMWSFSWSPNGLMLAFERNNEIWTVHASGRRLRRLTRSGYGKVAHGPVWSPDGSLILHDRALPDALWTMRPDGSRARKLADGEIYDRLWSPEGKRIGFGETDGFFVMDRDGSNTRRFPSLGLWTEWSPDGRRLASGGHTGGTLSPDPFPIVLTDVTTGQVTRATQRP